MTIPLEPCALSVVVVAYDMAREVPRTIRSLSRPYQCDVEDPYEIVVVDNGSPVPVELDGPFDPEVRVHRMAGPASVSPAAAVNTGVALARGELVGVIVDGARMASPGLIGQAMAAARLEREPFVATLAWHLGLDAQLRSGPAGYDRQVEDELLRSIDWPVDGYRLFEISCLAPSSKGGHLLPLPESSAVFLGKSLFERIGGFDERFDLPGGGLVAADFFRRAVEALDGDPIVLLGEGTFHQLHAEPTGRPYRDLTDDYRAIRGHDHSPPSYRPILYGRPHPSALSLLGRSALMAAALHPTLGQGDDVGPAPAGTNRAVAR